MERRNHQDTMEKEKEERKENPPHQEREKNRAPRRSQFSEEFTMAAKEVGEAIREVKDAFTEALVIVKEEYRKSSGNGMGLKDARSVEKILKKKVKQRLRHQIEEGAENSEPSYSPLDESESFEAYSLYYEKIQREAHRSPGEFWGHLVSFVVVNAGLMALNMLVTPGFPWALFPFGGWGIGLLTDLVKAFRKKEKLKELEKLPPLREEALELFKKLQKKKDEHSEEVAALVPTSLFLYMINMITTPGFMWSLIPIGGMVIGGLTGFFSKRGEITELERTLKNALQKGGMTSRRGVDMPVRRSEEKVSDPYEQIVLDARSLRDAIREMIQGTAHSRKGPPQPLPGTEEFLPLLDLYVEEIASLVDKRREIATIIEMIPVGTLQQDKVLLKKKLESTETSAMLREEYQRALANIEKQERSLRELQDEKELMEIKIRSSFTALQQMRLDVARLISLAGASQKGSIEQVDHTAEELRRYIQDLKAGYEELNQFESSTKRFLEQKNEVKGE
ncbi:MAG TPA: 2TM domain-containing protein [Termitinemataceae bacterium]|nr:2TM domain-containing protein [Termitinemataceae bacterium]HOM22287.1 2TM domain-containing protein [Termitinemataceae bacterium]HPP99291.1 2TM domain-containing protein [Termitinemataceae bacterium]